MTRPSHSSGALLSRRGRLRRLTLDEAALGHEMFGDGLATEGVRLFASPTTWPDRPFVAGPALIVWPWRHALSDFAAPWAPLRATATFVHELTHIWQAQKGVNLLAAKLRAGDGPGAYAYEATGLQDFPALNIEQQAMAVEHAFLASRGGPCPYPATAYGALCTQLRQA